MANRIAREIVGDWYSTEEDLKRMDRDREEFERENPNHPATIRGRKYRAEHPELFEDKPQAGSK